MVDKVTHEKGKSPIVATVLEEIHDGHGRFGKAVHEDCLENALYIVQRPASGGNSIASNNGHSRLEKVACTLT